MALELPLAGKASSLVPLDAQPLVEDALDLDCGELAK
jgi:hypothetical protein